MLAAPGPCAQAQLLYLPQEFLQMSQHSIPSKQRHYAGTYAELQANLLYREIGLCLDPSDAEHNEKCYINTGNSLAPLGGSGSIDPPSDTTKAYAYTWPTGGSAGVWSLLKKDPVGSGSSQTTALWTEMGGAKFAAERALKDEQGRSIKDAITALANKADRSSVTPGTYTKVSVNGDGIVTAGENLAASDIPNLPATKITSGYLDPERLEDGSVPVAKMEAKKQLALDNTLKATEAGTTVTLSANPGLARLAYVDLSSTGSTLVVPTDQIRIPGYASGPVRAGYYVPFDSNYGWQIGRIYTVDDVAHEAEIDQIEGILEALNQLVERIDALENA